MMTRLWFLVFLLPTVPSPYPPILLFLFIVGTTLSYRLICFAVLARTHPSLFSISWVS